MTCRYGALEFGTRLEAQWAAFFDLAGWKWRSNPAPIHDWRANFLVEFPCGHSECNSTHSLLVSVVPAEKLEGLETHPALGHTYMVKNEQGNWVADAGAVFGASPEISRWQMSHGAGGGSYDVPFWVDDARDLWRQAATKIG